MFGLSALELARIQFGFTVSFHIIFPAITIGLASYLAVLEGLWLWRKDTVYRSLYHFWSRIFAVNFAMSSPGWSWPTNSEPTGVISRPSPAASPARC
jgi:cytochrome bd-type quinol oxidase subunit 1